MVLPILRTGLHEGSQRPSHRFESPDLLVDVGDLRLGRCANLLAGHRRRIAQAKEVLNLGDGEAELLRSLDEADAADGSEGIVAGEIQEDLVIPPSTLSHLLDTLRQAGLVEQMREGKFQRYRAQSESLRSLIDFLYAECCTRSRAVAPSSLTAINRRK